MHIQIYFLIVLYLSLGGLCAKLSVNAALEHLWLQMSHGKLSWVQPEWENLVFNFLSYIEIH